MARPSPSVVSTPQGEWSVFVCVHVCVHVCVCAPKQVAAEEKASLEYTHARTHATTHSATHARTHSSSLFSQSTKKLCQSQSTGEGEGVKASRESAAMCNLFFQPQQQTSQVVQRSRRGSARPRRLTPTGVEQLRPELSDSDQS